MRSSPMRVAVLITLDFSPRTWCKIVAIRFEDRVKLDEQSSGTVPIASCPYDRFTFHFLRCPCHASLVSTFLQRSMFSTTFDRIPPFTSQASTNYLAARDNSSLGWKFLGVREPHGCIERSIKIRAEERLERHSPGGFQQPTANSWMPRGARVSIASLRPTSSISRLAVATDVQKDSWIVCGSSHDLRRTGAL